MEFLYLTTTGWKSGRAHEIEIWFVALDGAYYLVSEHGEESHWVRNIRRNAEISFWAEGRRHQGRARIVEPERDVGLAEQVRSLMDAKYEWSSGVIVELRPDPATP